MVWLSNWIRDWKWRNHFHLFVIIVTICECFCDILCELAALFSIPISVSMKVGFSDYSWKFK